MFSKKKKILRVEVKSKKPNLNVPSGYVFFDYPRWIYHKDFEPRLVSSQREHNEAGWGWSDSPIDPERKEST